MNETSDIDNRQAKVPALNLIFWIIKIAATTLGETAGDAVSMSMNLGYLIGTAIFAAIFLVAVVAQIKTQRFHPLLYWTTIVATTTVGTTLADFADRSLGIGYAGGTSLLFALLMASLATWYRVLGSVSMDTVSSPKAEMFYWITIMLSQTLGTALGDWTADSAGLGYLGGAVVFGSLLGVVVGFALNHRWTYAGHGARGAGVIARYLTVYAVSLAAGYVLLAVLVRRFGIDPRLGALATIAQSTCINYVGTRWLVFAA